MQWTLLVVAICIVIGGTYFSIVERRADRALANKNADTERMKAVNTARRLDTEHYVAVTKRIELELNTSRDSRLKSATLDLEHQREQQEYDDKFAPAGSPANPDVI